MSVCMGIRVGVCERACVWMHRWMLSTGGHRWQCGGYIVVVRARFFLPTNCSVEAVRFDVFESNL